MSEENDLNYYGLFRQFWDWAFENPDLVSTTHCAIYAFAIEHCNRLGWKEKFGFPSQMAMEAIGVKTWKKYIDSFNDLVEWGFFVLHQKAKNQYSANIIAIVKKTKAKQKQSKSKTKALDEALQKHNQKQREYNNTNIQPYNDTTIQTYKDDVQPAKFSFKQSLLDNGADEQLVNDWIKVRKTKDATNTKTALNKFMNQVELSGRSLNDVLTKCVEKSWAGFEVSWKADWEAPATKKQPLPTLDEIMAEKRPDQLKRLFMIEDMEYGGKRPVNMNAIKAANGTYKLLWEVFDAD